MGPHVGHIEQRHSEHFHTFKGQSQSQRWSLHCDIDEIAHAAVRKDVERIAEQLRLAALELVADDGGPAGGSVSGEVGGPLQPLATRFLCMCHATWQIPEGV